jgi:hypothetical protein
MGYEENIAETTSKVVKLSLKVRKKTVGITPCC